MGREFAARCGILVAEDDPEAGAIGFVVARTDGASELGEFQARAAEKFGEDAASVVDKIAKTLRNKDGVDVARSGLFELVEIVIGQRLFERDFDGGGRLVFVWGDSNGHGGYGFTLRRLVRIGAAGENGKGAIKLLGERDAGELVRKGHRAERKFVVGALREVVGEAVGVAAEEDEFARAAIAEFAKPFGEGVRIQVLPCGIKKDDGGDAIGVEFLTGGVGITNFGDFDGARPADAFYVVVENSAHLGAARFSKHEEAEFHFRPYFLRFSRRVLRLMPRASAERLIW